MLKRVPSSRNKTPAQSHPNPLSLRNLCFNQSFYSPSSSQPHSNPVEYTLDLKNVSKTSFKAPSKKSLEPQPLGSSTRDNIENSETHAGPTLLAMPERKTPENRIDLSDPLRSNHSDKKQYGHMDKMPSSMSRLISERDIIFEKESEEDIEIKEKINKLQNDLGKLDAYGTRNVSSPTHMKYPNLVDVISQLREIIHKLQLKDAVQRQEISKLKKSNQSLKTKVQEYEQKLKEIEKNREKDLQYLIKVDNYLLNKKRNKENQKTPLPEKVPVPIPVKRNDASNLRQKMLDVIKDKDKRPSKVKTTVRPKDPKKDDKPMSNLYFHSASVSDISNTKLQFMTRSNSLAPNETRDLRLFFRSVPVPEMTGREENDTFGQVKTITMSDIENPDETALPSNLPIFKNNASIFNESHIRAVNSPTSSLIPSKTDLSKNENNLVCETKPISSYNNLKDCTYLLSPQSRTPVLSQLFTEERSEISNRRNTDVGSHLQISQNDSMSLTLSKQPSSISLVRASPSILGIPPRHKPNTSDLIMTPTQSSEIVKSEDQHSYPPKDILIQKTLGMGMNKQETLPSKTQQQQKNQRKQTQRISVTFDGSEFEDVVFEYTEEEKVSLFNKRLKLSMGLNDFITSGSTTEKASDAMNLENN